MKINGIHSNNNQKYTDGTKQNKKCNETKNENGYAKIVLM